MLSFACQPSPENNHLRVASSKARGVPKREDHFYVFIIGELLDQRLKDEQIKRTKEGSRIVANQTIWWLFDKIVTDRIYWGE
jgi:hypothetical protein